MERVGGLDWEVVVVGPSVCLVGIVVSAMRGSRGEREEVVWTLYLRLLVLLLRALMEEEGEREVWKVHGGWRAPRGVEMEEAGVV